MKALRCLVCRCKLKSQSLLYESLNIIKENGTTKEAPWLSLYETPDNDFCIELSGLGMVYSHDGEAGDAFSPVGEV